MTAVGAHSRRAVAATGSFSGDIDAALRSTRDLLQRFVVLPGEAERRAVCLWIAHTHAIGASHATPYLLILSPEKRSGKTRLTEVLELLVAAPWRVTGASEAAIFRKIATERPTLLLDEIDAVFGSHTERTEPLRAILNAGNRPGASVARCVGEKGDRVKDFPVFCAKALAGIDRGDKLPDTLRDRGIVIEMRRKKTAEAVERFRHRHVAQEADRLARQLSHCAETAHDDLYRAEPDIPNQLDDRAAEAWEPLFAIADLAGGSWPAAARGAAVELAFRTRDSHESAGIAVLSAVRAVFGADDRLTTSDLLLRLNSDDELPYGGWREGKGLDGRGLARLLRPYRVRPRSIRVDQNPNQKGYLRSQFEEAWDRWLPRPARAPQAPRTTVTMPDISSTQADVADVADAPLRSGRAVEPEHEALTARESTSALGISFYDELEL